MSDQNTILDLLYHQFKQISHWHITTFHHRSPLILICRSTMYFTLEVFHQKPHATFNTCGICPQWPCHKKIFSFSTVFWDRWLPHMQWEHCTITWAASLHVVWATRVKWDPQLHHLSAMSASNRYSALNAQLRHSPMRLESKRTLKPTHSRLSPWIHRHASPSPNVVDPLQHSLCFG